MSDVEDGTPTDVRETLELQLSEIELLQSMYSNDGEFSLDDPSALSDILQFMDDGVEYTSLNSRLGFLIAIKDDQDNSVEIACRLSHSYPSVTPEVFARSDNLSNAEYKQFHDALYDFIFALDRGVICITLIVQWIQEHLHTYIKTANTDGETFQKEVINIVFSRLWIYSHHIYSKIKRKDILEMAGELQLSGFSLPGKPGVVCVEGFLEDVDEFWHRLRRMCWKRLMIKEKLDIPLDGRQLSELRLFGKFEEKDFSPRSGKGREYHMDLGVFYQFLIEHHCGAVFSAYFGVEGHSLQDQ